MKHFLADIPNKMLWCKSAIRLQLAHAITYWVTEKCLISVDRQVSHWARQLDPPYQRIWSPYSLVLHCQHGSTNTTVSGVFMKYFEDIEPGMDAMQVQQAIRKDTPCTFGPRHHYFSKVQLSLSEKYWLSGGMFSTAQMPQNLVNVSH